MDFKKTRFYSFSSYKETLIRTEILITKK